MNIAIDTNCIVPGRVGGIENYTLGLIEALQSADSPASRLLLLTRPENHQLFEPFADAWTELHLMERPTFGGQPVSNWDQLFKTHPLAGQRLLQEFQYRKAEILDQERIDLIHFPGNTINPLELDLPVVLNLHDLQHRHFPQYFSRQELDNREKWWVESARRANALIAASNYVREDLQTQMGINPANIFVTPDCFQAAFFAQPSQAQLDDLRTRMELAETFFIYPAAVWPHKNHAILIRAFAAADIDGAQLILTGGGQEESDLPQFVAELGLTGCVKFAGRVSTDDLIGLYHLAASMIFPSQHESWSIPVMEAMACGCPVASSNVTSLPEEIGDAGLLFSPDDLDSMVGAMQRLAGDPKLRQVLSERGRERVKQFGSEQFLRTISMAYNHACLAYRSRMAA
jgi:glycosyltransferase involved in cell wall biosynthesis